MSLLASSLWRNQFGATRKSEIFHGTIKAVVSDIYASFLTHLWGDPTLDASGKMSLILQQQLQGYKVVYPPMKHHKAIPSNMVFQIYKKQYSHLITDISNLDAGAFFLGIRSCKYSTNPKGEHKQTRIQQKGDIKFCMKRHKLLHSSRCIHLAYKVSQTFRT